MTFFIGRTVLRGATSLIVFLQYLKRSRNLIYQIWPEQNTKVLCIYIGGLEIEISRKLYLMYGHGGHLEK